MGQSTFRAVVKRAFAETRSEIRVDTPVRIVISFVSPFVSAAVVWWFTHSFALGGIAGVAVLVAIGLVVFIGKLFTVPIVMVRESEVDRHSLTNDFGLKIEVLERRISELMAPPLTPERYADGIYQNGELVGIVSGAHEDNGSLCFSEIEDTENLDQRLVFVFHEKILFLESHQSFTGTSMNMIDTDGGTTVKTAKAVMGGVKCHVLGTTDTVKHPVC